MLNKLNRKFLLIALTMTVASCSANKKNTETSYQQNAPVEIQQTSENESQTVYFDTNSAELTADAIAILKDKILADAKNNEAKIVIEAHCDERGSIDYNQKLSIRRAEAVKNYLTKNGVKDAKIKTVGYGKSKPVDLGHDESSWAKNRRAVTIIIGK